MINMKKLAMGAVVALSLVSASSASAADWMPLNTAVTGTQHGVGKMTVAGGLAVSCSAGDASLTAPSGNPSVASTNSPSFSSCKDPLNADASVTTFGTWHFTAVDTTNVHILATGPGAGGTGSVATIHLPTLGCSITVQGPVTIGGNDWNGASRILTINSAVKFPIIPSTEGCQTLVGTTGSIDASYTLPAGVSIT